MGVLDADGPAEGGPETAVDAASFGSSPSSCWKPASSGVGDAKMLCGGSLSA